MLDALVFCMPFGDFLKNLMLVQNADTTKTHGFTAFYGVGEEKTLLQSHIIGISWLFSKKCARFFPCLHHPVPLRHYLTPVTHRNAPCARLRNGIGKMYHKADVSARWPDLDQAHFPGVLGKILGAKCVQVKNRVA